MPTPWQRLGHAFLLVLLAPCPSAPAVDTVAYIQSEQQFGRVTIETKLGRVVGRVLPGGVRGFLGIPYALPPVEKLRFEPPVPVASWGGDKLRALEFGAECMQSIEGNPSPPKSISEDCLFLNLWTPAGARNGSKLPVMVWLYGGGFQQGASSHPEYDGKRLAERGVVVVSLNYRVGALGWMVSVGDNLWGNYGLQDQRLGLEWVHDNVASFGGDPGRVTLFGESAGAMSIGQHLHMDGAGVLFQQVVMQSNPIGYRFRSVTVANFLGEAMKRGLDCATLDCLQSEPASEVMRVQESIMGLPRSVGDFFTWGPVVTDRNYRRHVGKHQKTWNSDAQQAEAKARQRREARTVSLTGSGSGKGKKGTAGQKASGKTGSSGGSGSSGSKSSGSSGSKSSSSSSSSSKRSSSSGSSSGRSKKSSSSSSSVNRSPTRLGPRQNYTAPFMNVVQPLEALADAATAASSARARGAVGIGGGGRGRGGARGRGRGWGRDDDQPPPHPPIPVMLGVNADEGLMFVHGAFPVTMPKFVYYSFVTALFRTSVFSVLRAYGHLAAQCQESGDYRRVMSQIMHDYLFRCPTLRAAQLLQEQNGRDAPVFVYEFSHPTEVPGFPECSGSSCHTAELPYVFNNLDIIKESYSYHETSGPAAPPPPPLKGVKHPGLAGSTDGGGSGGPLTAVGNALGGAAGGVGGALGSAAGGVGNAVGGVAGGVGSAVGTVAGGVGGAVGGVAGGVVGAVRSGFGIPRLLGIGRQTSSSPGEEVAGAIGGGGAGLAGKLAAEVTEMTAEAFAPAAPKEGEGEGKEASGKQEGGSAVAAAGSSGPGARARAGATSKGEGEAEICGNPPQDGGNAGSSGNGGSSASGSGGSGGSGSAGAGERGLGGSSCAAMAGNFDDGSDGALSEDGGGDTRRPPRPTKDQAAEADMLVGEAMVAYWASFGKVGDPNSANAPVLWPAWEGRRLAAQGNTAGAAAMAAMLASGRGGVGKGSFGDVFAEAWSNVGTSAAAGGGIGDGSGAWGGGSFFLDISAHPEVQEAQQDCLCEFWDRLKYRH